MEKNKYYCPECGAEMYEKYDKPALNLTCPKCGCKVATTRWEAIDLDSNEYEVIIMPITDPSIDILKTVSKIIGKNFILTKNELIEGCTVFIGRAVEAKKVITLLNEKDIKYRVLPDFPY